jgi:hypothetical protein
MNIVLAKSDIAQHPVIQPGKPHMISPVLCETGKVSRRTPAPHQKARHARWERPPGSICEIGTGVKVSVRLHFH